MNGQARAHHKHDAVETFSPMQMKAENKGRDLSIPPSFFPYSQKNEGKPEVERQDLAGVQRVMVELGGNPEMQKFCRQYADKVDDMVKILRDDMGIKPKDEEGFVTGIWGIMRGSFNVKYGLNELEFLSESLKTNDWDCKNSAFLVFDAAKELGIDAKMAGVPGRPGHALVAMKKIFFETTNGQYFPIDELKIRYPVIYLMTSDVKAIQSISYKTRGLNYAKQGSYEKAVSDFTKAIELAPNDADSYCNRGNAYAEMGLHEKANRDLIKAREIELSLSLNKKR